MQKRILILTAGFGEGHNAAALQRFSPARFLLLSCLFRG